MSYEHALKALLGADGQRMKALEAVRTLELPDCWIGGGFVRDAVWDHLHGAAPTKLKADVDVLWFDCDHVTADCDALLENRLKALLPELDWSMKNQARMHHYNGDNPFGSVSEAMTHWVETASAVAVRLTSAGLLEVNAPLGLDDLFALRLAPTVKFSTSRRSVFDERVSAKRWLERYPLLRLECSAAI